MKILMLTVGLMLAGCGSIENHGRNHGFPPNLRGTDIHNSSECFTLSRISLRISKAEETTVQIANRK
jgi:hypothetical protein